MTAMYGHTIQVVVPPQFEPFQPYLSGPYLKSLLAQWGVRASVFDANIGFYEWLVGHATKVPWPIAPTQDGDYLRKHVASAVGVLRTEPNSLADYRWAVNVLDRYLNAISPKGVKVGLTSLRVANRYSSAALRAYLDSDDNVFSLYFNSVCSDIMGPEGVSAYLLSVVVIDQLPAAIAFAREIRQRRPLSRIMVGGPLVSRLHRQMSSISWIAQAFDAIVPGEAHLVLPGILGLKDCCTGHVTPDFSDLDLGKYWSCRRVLPYLVTRGCKWGKCEFCSHHLTYDGYSETDMEKVISDLAHTATRYRAEYVSFCDEYLTPEQLRRLAKGLDHKVNLKWSTFVRPEPQFRDGEFLGTLYDAGCRMLMFGLESGSQRVLKAMRKGTRAEHYRPILDACKSANIAVRCDFMVGFPGETESDVRKTYSFIRDNRDVLDTPFSSYAVAILEMRTGIPLLEKPERFGIRMKEPLRGDLDDQHEFELSGGLSKEMCAKWRGDLIRVFKTEMMAEIICPQNKTHQLVLKDLYDKGAVELPTLQIAADRLGSLMGSLGPGVLTRRAAAGLRVLSHASGGELAVGPRLVDVFRRLAKGTRLDLAFQSQDLWNEETFARFITFLYRNDYVLVWEGTEGRHEIGAWDVTNA